MKITINEISKQDKCIMKRIFNSNLLFKDICVMGQLRIRYRIVRSVLFRTSCHNSDVFQARDLRVCMEVITTTMTTSMGKN